MKRVISVALSVILLFAAVSPAFAAEFNTDYPVIVLPGYSSSNLELVHEDGTTEKIWGLDYEKILQEIKPYLAQFAASLVKLRFDDGKSLAALADPGIKETLEPLACNPDGTSKYTVRTMIPNTADGCRYSTIGEYYEMATYVNDVISEDQIFIFQCDFRLGVLENVAQLHDLILDVLADTGAEKVNLLSQSYGGQIAGTYLSVYKDVCADYINNAVLCVPAIGGAALAYDLFTGHTDVNEYSILEFAEQALFIDSDIHWLLASEPLDILDAFLKAVLPSVLDCIVTWQAMWDFIPLYGFDEVLALHGDKVSPELRNKTIAYHRDYMAKLTQNLQEVQRNGVNVSITCGTGTPSETGSQINSDGIIPACGASGATTAPFGKRFADGYTCIGETCADPSHDHLSPSMEVDASTCYLPENTWFVDGYYHGQETKDAYLMNLVRRQLISAQPLRDVHESADFPQFHASSGYQMDLFASFNKAPEGYITGDTDAIVLTNLTDSPLIVYDIDARGFEPVFDAYSGLIIPAGKSAKVAFTGEIPSVSNTRAAVTISFVRLLGTATPIMTRTFDFTFKNGPAPTYDADHPYADVDFTIDPSSDHKETKLDRLLHALTLFFENLKRFITTVTELIGSIPRSIHEMG